MTDWRRLVEDLFARDAAWENELCQVRDLLASFGETRDPADLEYGKQHDRLCALVRSKGWSRRRSYALFFEQLHPDMPHDDLVSNFLDGLCGWCGVDSIMRFDGDPEDPREVARYARGTTWMHEDRYSGPSDPRGLGGAS